MPKPAPKKNLNINLLTQDEFSSSFIGKFLLWALSIGRYIVVITELIVIISFLSRFKLDRDLTDTNEAIEQQKAVILSYGDLETRFKNAQNQLAFIGDNTPVIETHEALTLLENTLPFDVRLNSLSVTGSNVNIEAIALSLSSFGQFINSLLNQPNVTNVSLGKVSAAEQGNVVEFNLQIAFESP